MEERTSDNSKLHEYLKENLEAFPKGEEALKMFQFSAGTSNPTFLLRKSWKEFVLRQKAPTQVYLDYHKVDVEYKILKLLSTTSIPVPKVYLFCEDASIMGQEFYVMEYIKSRQFPDHNLPDLTPDQRKAIYEKVIETLAKLHAVNVDEFDAQGMGDKNSYLKERIKRLHAAYKRVEKKEIPKVQQLMEWLQGNIPETFQKAVIHHADFRVPNFLIHPEKTEIVAMLDWEGASWGHPFEDLAYFCLPYHLPDEVHNLPMDMSYASDGIPSEDEILSLYCKLAGQSLPLPNWNFFMGLAFYCAVLNMQTFITHYSRAECSEFLRAGATMLEPLLEPILDKAFNVIGLK